MRVSWRHGSIAAMPSTLRNVNYQGPFGNTLLHGAVVSGDLSEVERLLAAGADPTIVNRDGKTALDAAVLLGFAEILGVIEGSFGDRRQRTR